MLHDIRFVIIYLRHTKVIFCGRHDCSINLNIEEEEEKKN